MKFKPGTVVYVQHECLIGNGTTKYEVVGTCNGHPLDWAILVKHFGSDGKTFCCFSNNELSLTIDEAIEKCVKKLEGRIAKLIDWRNR